MTGSNPSAPSPVTSDAADPLATLHHMSTTAGVASQKYVAVSTAAIIGALLGVASSLAVFSNLLLAIPVMGIIVSVVAWHHIRNSGGTETGAPMAILGLLLSLGIGGTVVGRSIQRELKVRHDVGQMAAIFNQLTDAVKNSRYDQAYQLFDGNFQNRVSEDTLRSAWTSYQRPEVYGQLDSMKWNGVEPAYQSVHGGDERLAYISALAKFQNSDLRLTFMFRDSGSGWHLENLTEFFGAPK